ncbi:MAG: sugar ABC transporter permease [Caldilineaceae bacterium]|nr:sugar ABC transporter permease [Caldilineaceae bacterium]
MTQRAGALESHRPLTVRRSHGIGATIRRILRKPQFWFGVTVIIPTLIWYWFFAYQPIILAFRLAVVKYQILDPAGSPFVGLDNFRQLFANPLFMISVRNTISWAVFSFVGMLPLSLGIALCLVNVRHGRNLYQGILFLPVVISLVAIALLFRMLMDPEIGQFNRILESIGLPPFDWLSSSKTALPTAVGIGIWKGLGFYIVILTAGMLNIPMEIHDAATVDGVNAWQRFRFITLPLLSHTLALVMVILAIGALQEFTGVFVLTNGGPGNSTYMFNLLIYQEAFQDIRFGTATAAALIQFVFIIIITVLQLRLIRPSWSY